MVDRLAQFFEVIRKIELLIFSTGCFQTFHGTLRRSSLLGSIEKEVPKMDHLQGFLRFRSIVQIFWVL
jgi:hypothetical protein